MEIEVTFPGANIADRLSFYPVAQQLVGILTIGSNLCKLGGNVVTSVYNAALKIFSNLMHEPDTFRDKFSGTTDYSQYYAFIKIGLTRITQGLGTSYSEKACEEQLELKESFLNNLKAVGELCLFDDFDYKRWSRLY